MAGIVYCGFGGLGRGGVAEEDKDIRGLVVLHCSEHQQLLAPSRVQSRRCEGGVVFRRDFLRSSYCFIAHIHNQLQRDILKSHSTCNHLTQGNSIFVACHDPENGGALPVKTQRLGRFDITY